MSEERQEVASSTGDRNTSELAVGVLPAGRVSDSLGTVVERLKTLRRTGRLDASETRELVALVERAVSEAYRVAESRTESPAQNTQPQAQLPRAYEPAVRRFDAIDHVRCDACKIPLTGADGYITAMSCKNFRCEKYALVIRNAK